MKPRCTVALLVSLVAGLLVWRRRPVRHPDPSGSWEPAGKRAGGRSE
jgi:hypothetical protein